MKRIYRIWLNGRERLVYASSKKEVKEAFKTDNVDFWCLAKEGSILSNVPYYKDLVSIPEVIDENGAIRYQMKPDALNKLYRDLENFIADITTAEYEENKDAIKKVQTLIHQRSRNN